MTRRGDLEHHRDSLEEIGEILGSMKTLAYMETRKLSRFLATQEKMAEAIATVASDFFEHFPRPSTALPDAPRVLLVVGSERGFCGDFNRALARRLRALAEAERGQRRLVLCVGQRLRTLLGDDIPVAAVLEGASAAEELPAVLQSVIAGLDSLAGADGGMTLTAIHQEGEAVTETPLLPPRLETPGDGSGRAIAPLLNVPPAEFLRDLLDHYLFAALNRVLYTSLMAENQQRVFHLESAARHIDQTSAELTRKCRALRQEEIVEEIEVILLSTAGLPP